MDPDELLTPREVADILKVKVGTLAVWRSLGSDGPAWIKLNGSVRYRRAAVEAWINAQAGSAA